MVRWMGLDCAAALGSAPDFSRRRDLLPLWVTLSGAAEPRRADQAFSAWPSKRGVAAVRVTAAVKRQRRGRITVGSSPYWYRVAQVRFRWGCGGRELGFVLQIADFQKADCGGDEPDTGGGEGGRVLGSFRRMAFWGFGLIVKELGSPGRFGSRVDCGTGF